MGTNPLEPPDVEMTIEGFVFFLAKNSRDYQRDIFLRGICRLAKEYPSADPREAISAWFTFWIAKYRHQLERLSKGYRKKPPVTREQRLRWLEELQKEDLRERIAEAKKNRTSSKADSGTTYSDYNVLKGRWSN